MEAIRSLRIGDRARNYHDLTSQTGAFANYVMTEEQATEAVQQALSQLGKTKDDIRKECIALLPEWTRSRHEAEWPE